MTKMCSSYVDVLTVYRSSGGNKDELLKDIISLIDAAKSTVLCGDFNLCSAKEKNGSFSKTLKNMGFEEKVKVATHIKGGHIDHVYFYCPNKKLSLDAMLYSPYYPTKDHDAICSTVKML
jgi:exonuclease III